MESSTKKNMREISIIYIYFYIYVKVTYFVQQFLSDRFGRPRSAGQGQQASQQVSKQASWQASKEGRKGRKGSKVQGREEYGKALVKSSGLI